MLQDAAPKSFRNAFHLLCWEGAFAMAYETWIGPSYLSGVAGEMGVEIGLLSLLVAIPWIGAIGQLFTIGFCQEASSFKTYVIRLARAARVLWVIPFALAVFWGVRAYLKRGEFPAEAWFTITALIGCAASLIGSASGAAWSAWVRELSPQSFRGRFFGVRQRYTMGAVTAAHGLAFFWIGWKPLGFHAGYALLLGCALVCAVFSTTLLGRVPDVVKPKTKLAVSFREPFENERFRELLFLGAAFNGAVQLAGPYFPYYFTHDLKIPMSTVSGWTLLMNLGWFLAAVSWGKKLDRSARLSSAFWIAIHGIALSPALYWFLPVEWTTHFAPFEYFVSGVLWAGFNLAFTTLLLRHCPPDRCAFYMSVNTACSGAACALGNFAGGQIAAAFGFQALFLFSAVARLGVIWGLTSFLSQAPRLYNTVSRLKLRSSRSG